MGVSDSLRCLTSIVQEMEGEGFDVSDVETRTARDGLSSQLTLELQLIPERLNDTQISLDVHNTEVHEDGTTRLDVSVCLPDDADVKAITGAEAMNDEGRKVYKDPERLKEVYEACDTFPAMTEALGVDVTPKTVRNHMVKHGIHDPESNKTQRPDDAREDRFSSEFDAENRTPPEQDDNTPEEPFLADGLGLPDEVELIDIKESVQTATTLTEFRRNLGIDDEYARVILKELNLIDLVYGRISRDSNRVVSMDDIETRIQSAAGNAL